MVISFYYLIRFERKNSDAIQYFNLREMRSFSIIFDSEADQNNGYIA